MAKAPDWFLKELKEFDPDLRCRWSSKDENFHIERKVTRGMHPGTIRNDGFHDDYIRAQDGYILVGVIRPGHFSRHTFQVLRDSDMWANGGWEEVDRKLCAFEEAEEEHKWAVFDDESAAACRELYSLLKIRCGETFFNVGHPE
jgi:hypothetical protein